MNTRLIWITGRAAAGKSTLVTELATALRAHGLSATVYVDEHILLDLVRADSDHIHHWHPGPDHRIAFHCGHLFDESLRILNARLLDKLDDGNVDPVIIELARGRRNPPIDVTYRHALDLLDTRLWPHSHVFRLDVDFAVQLHRNQTRHTGTGDGTPTQIMRDLYREDDPTSFVDAGIPITTLPAADPPASNAARILTASHLPHRPHNI